MSFIGFNPNVPASVDGCGGGGATAPMPRPRFNPDGTVSNGFSLPTLDEQPDPFGGERFLSSQGGGFIVSKDGELVGRIPANSYVDTKTGTVYGPDDTKIDIPEGANVDFRDLPDLDTILEMVKVAADGGGEGEITGERFVPSEAGGLIIGKDGDVAGRIPAGSFVDVKDGKVYGPDSKAIELPEGASVDFFDLPSIDELKTQARGGGPAAKGAKAHPEWSYAFPQTAVDGQWGPGGVTSFKGGAKDSQVGGMHGAGEDCGMDHGGPTSTKAGGATGTAVPAGLQRMLEQQLAQLNGGYGPFAAGAFRPALGGGPGTAVAGARGLGSLPSLDASLRELVLTLRELTDALAKTAGGDNSTTQTGTQTGTQTSTESTPTTDSGSSTSTSTTTTTTTSSDSDSSSTDDSSSSSSSSSSTTT
jgi:hypothetical protein